MRFAILISGGSLKLHISSAHEEKKLFKCEKCGKSFQHKKSLTGHVAHEGKKPFKCDICDYNCSIEGNMNSRTATVHEGKNHLNVIFVIIAFCLRET